MSKRFLQQLDSLLSITDTPLEGSISSFLIDDIKDPNDRSLFLSQFTRLIYDLEYSSLSGFHFKSIQFEDQRLRVRIEKRFNRLMEMHISQSESRLNQKVNSRLSMQSLFDRGTLLRELSIDDFKECVLSKLVPKEIIDTLEQNGHSQIMYTDLAGFGNITHNQILRMGVPQFRDRSVQSGELRMLDVHGSPMSPYIYSGEPNVRLAGGDLLLVSCYRNAQSALKILESSTSRASGVIHTKNVDEAVYSSIFSVPRLGRVISSDSRLNTNTSNNPFVRTTIDHHNMPLEPSKEYRNINGTPIYLERSPSACRLYIGPEENYFARRNDILNELLREQQELYKQINPEHPDHIEIDFKEFERRGITELELYQVIEILFDLKQHNRIMLQGSFGGDIYDVILNSTDPQKYPSPLELNNQFPEGFTGVNNDIFNQFISPLSSHLGHDPTLNQIIEEITDLFTTMPYASLWCREIVLDTMCRTIDSCAKTTDSLDENMQAIIQKNINLGGSRAYDYLENARVFCFLARNEGTLTFNKQLNRLRARIERVQMQLKTPKERRKKKSSRPRVG